MTNGARIPGGGAIRIPFVVVAEATHTYGLYTGARLTPYFQVYVDGEMARGAGLSHTLGLAGLPMAM